MNLEEEIRVLESRFSAAPDSRLFLPLADALRRAGELERAIKLCREGLEKFPGFTSARVLLGECLKYMDRHEEAQAVFEEVTAADKGNLSVLKNLADLAERKGDKEQALRFYHEALAVDAADDESAMALETLKKEFEPSRPSAAPQPHFAEEMESGQAEKSGEEEIQVIEELPLEKMPPGELFLTHTLADIYRLQGHYDRAYEIYRKLLENVGEDRELRRKLDEVSAYLESESRESPLLSGDKKLPVAEAGLAGSSGSADILPGADLQIAAGGIESKKNVSPENWAGKEGNVTEPTVDEADRIGPRIESIFRFLLGDQSWPETEAQLSGPLEEESAGAEEFVGMLEQWISNLKTTGKQ